jgi:ABC-2 type transport system permease protein
MTTVEGTVYDLGYTPHDGERLGRSGALRAIFVDGLRRALGLRRKPWAKVLPWGLIAAAIVPAAWFVALTRLVSGLSVEDLGPFASPPQLFQIIGTMWMLFAALVTPTLLIPDRRHGVLSVYASRPVRATDYLMARIAVIVLLGTLFVLVPQALMYIGVSALNVGGIWAGLTTNADQILPILGTTVALVLAYAAPAVLVSLYVGRVPIATGVYVVSMFMSAAISDAFPLQSDLLIFKVLAPFSLFLNPHSFGRWLFEMEDGGGSLLARVDLPLWVGGIAILVVALLTGALAVARYRKYI